MHPDCINFDDCKNTYIEEMKAGLMGKASSLFMIPAYLSAQGQLVEGETAIAIDIGGTNLRTALTRFSGGCIQILTSDEGPVPGLQNEITKEEFFREIARRLEPYINESSRIGVSFSHAAEILPSRDGRLISFSKEIRVTGSGGMEITKELAQTLYDLEYHANKSYTLLNDTTAVLLGGAAASIGRAYDGYIGFVLGTGMNLCYVEKTAEIKKLEVSYPHETMIVNTESAYFSRMPTGVIDRELDGTTINPGMSLLEKMTGGRYLGQLILLTLKRAAGDKLLSNGAGTAVLARSELLPPEIDSFLADTHGRNTLSDMCQTEEDRQIFFTVADRLIERAAKLSAMAVAAVMEKTDTGRRTDRPVCIVAEGSTFHKLYSFEEKFNDYVRHYINGVQKRYCHIVKVENATLLGSAYAALTN